jgi:hypothetical protein
MKKILTFLVMLLCSVSILMAQPKGDPTNVPTISNSATVENNPGQAVTDQPAVAPKFPYQAVVRDQTAKNLFSNQPVKINIKITENGENNVVFEENHNAETNLNGMVSILIGGGTNVSGNLTDIEWNNNVIVAATFKDSTDQVISLVETPVMPVPYALQADNSAFTITTPQIVNYLSSSNTDKNDVDSVLQAIVDNPNGLKQYCKDTVYHYFMNHKAEMRDLALYFIGLVDTNDIKDANNAVSPVVKTKALELVKQYIKDNKDAAKEILMYYLSQATKQDVKDLWDAVTSNPAFDTVGEVIADTAVKYVKAHPQMVQDVVEYYIGQATVSQVNYLHNLLKSNTAVYGRLVQIFDTHLKNYLDSKHYLTGICEKPTGGYDTISFCDLAARVKTLQNSVMDNCAFTAEQTGDKVFTLTTQSSFEGDTFEYEIVCGSNTITLSNNDVEQLSLSENKKSMVIRVIYDAVQTSGCALKITRRSNTYGCNRTVSVNF